MSGQQDPNRLVGTVLGSRFEIMACLAVDEAGARYSAQDKALNSPASVRVLHQIRPDDASLRRLLELLTEVSNLAIPGIRPLRAVGRTRTQDVYYATDAVSGKSLAQRLEQGAMRPADAVNALAQAGETLNQAHLHGVVHGALHPGAVILTGTRKDDTVYLLDFGLGPLVIAANVLPMGSKSAATPYQSPEQAKGDPFDQTADVYAMGALLYEAVTGRPPFAGRSALEILAHQLRGEAPSLSEIEPSFEGSPLQNVIDQSMQIDPQNRFSSIDAFVTALRNAGRSEATRKKPPLKAKAKGTKGSIPPAAAARKDASLAERKRKSHKLAAVRSFNEPRGSSFWYIVGGALLVAAILTTTLWAVGVFEEEIDLSELPNPAVTADPDRSSMVTSADETTEESTTQRPRQSLSREANTERPQSDPSSTENPEAIPQVEPLPPRALKLVNEGQEALKNKQYSRAINKFRSAKRAAPDAPEIARGLGLALMYHGQTSAAASELERYLKLRPHAPDARFVRSSIRNLRD